jgi:hypothetical protein
LVIVVCIDGSGGFCAEQPACESQDQKNHDEVLVACRTGNLYE